MTENVEQVFLLEKVGNNPHGSWDSSEQCLVHFMKAVMLECRGFGCILFGSSILLVLFFYVQSLQKKAQQEYDSVGFPSSSGK